jgi:hypothetical protein
MSAFITHGQHGTPPGADRYKTTMRIIRDVTEDEMVLAFLQGELDSPNYGECLAPFTSVILSGDLTDDDSNDARRQALGRCRGYPNNALFAGFPQAVDWKLVELTTSELGEFFYISGNEGWWVIGGGSRRVAGAADRSEAEMETLKPEVLDIEQQIQGGKTYPPLIAAAESEADRHVLVEGHTRATAYVRALLPEHRLEVIVGYGPELWRWFRR